MAVTPVARLASFNAAPAFTRNLPQSAQKPWFLEWVFAAFTLITYQGAFFPVLRTIRQGDDATEAGDPIARFALLGIVAMLLVLSIVQWRRLLPVVRMIWPYWVFILFCLASTAWSDSQMLTFRRSISLFGCFLFAAYAFTRFGPQRFILLLAGVGGAAALGSLLLVVAAPGLANDTSYFDTSAIRGVYSQKNQMSAYNLLGLCASFSLIFLEFGLSRRSKHILAVLSLMMIATLLLSRGLSSLIAFCAVSLVVMLYYDKASWRVRLLAGYFLFALVALVAFLVLADPADLLGAAGKDTSLTGRLPLWIECLNAIAERPFTGYGYAAFWDSTLDRTQYIWLLVGWPAPSAHDGYMDTILSVGVFAGAFYFFICGRAAVLAVRFARFDVPGLKWFVLYCTAMFIVNIDEGTLAWPDAIAIQMAFGTCLVESYLAKRRVS
jgi:exopolysaccharide production protein ExoQ